MLAQEWEAGDLPMVEHGVLLNRLPSLGGVAVQAAQAFREGPMGIALYALGCDPRPRSGGAPGQENKGPAPSLAWPNHEPPP